MSEADNVAGEPIGPDGTTALRTAIGAAVGTRLVFMPLAWASSWLLASSKGTLDASTFLRIWERWDAVILLRIAEVGYARADQHATAFFPLYPMLVRIVRFAVPSYLIAGLVVSLAASVVAFWFLYRLAEEEIGEGAGRRAVLYLALFPTSVFLIAPYSESLFLAGAIAAFYHARRRRWALVALPAAVATAARFAGIFVLIGLAVEVVRARPRGKDGAVAVGAIFAGLAPLIGYMAYLWAVHGSPTRFIEHQRLGWHRQFVGPIQSFRSTWNATSPDYPTNWIFAWKVEIVAAVIGVLAIGVAVAKREWSYAAFMTATMAVLMTSTWYYSIPRMLLSMFPIVLFMAARVHRRSREHEWIIAASTAIAALGVIAFTRHMWFF